MNENYMFITRAINSVILNKSSTIQDVYIANSTSEFIVAVTTTAATNPNRRKIDQVKRHMYQSVARMKKWKTVADREKK